MAIAGAVFALGAGWLPACGGQAALAAPAELWTKCDKADPDLTCSTPRGVAASPANGHIYIADQVNRRVEELNALGQFIRAWGWDVAVGGGSGFEVCTPPGEECKTGTVGGGAGQFEAPTGIALDSVGNVYVTDFSNGGRVEKFAPNGQFQLMWGGGVVNGGATGTGDLSSDSTAVTSVSTTSKAFGVGQRIEAAGIAAGTTIAKLEAGKIVLSQAATTSGTAVALTAPEGSGNVPLNELQTVTLGANTTGGAFTLSFSVPNPSNSNATTSAIPFNASATQLREALEALGNVGGGNVGVSGPAGGPWTVEFKGARFADTNVSQIGANASGLEVSSGVKQAQVATTRAGASAGEVCSVAADCQASAKGTGNGQFGAWVAGAFVTVDPTGKVYVGDQERIQRFDTGGAYQSQCSLPSGMTVEGLASDSAGALYAIYEGQVGVRKLNFVGGGECAELQRFDIPEPDEFTHPKPTAVAVDGAGHVYAFSSSATGNGFVHLDRIFEFDPAGKVIDQFGKDEFIASTGMAANLCAESEAPGNLYVANSTNGTGPPQSNEAFVRAYGTNPIGCFKARTLAAASVAETTATLNGTVNPSGLEVSECFFEYGTSAAYGQKAECVPGHGALGEGSKPVAVHADIGPLGKGAVYHFRLVAKVGAELETGADEEFKTLGPPVISADQAGGVTESEAKLGALVNPEGFATSYHFEYGATSLYGQSTAEIAIGSDRSAHAVVADLSGLAADTTYHWRIVATNSSGTSEGEDHVLTTYRPFLAETGCANQALRSGASAFLPDCRAYEIVSPLDKNGADIVLPAEQGGNVQARPDGNKLTYTATASFAGEANASNNNQYIATRGAGGWSNEGIHPPVGGGGTGTGLFGLIREFMIFTPDLCDGWLVDNQTPPATADGQPVLQNLYRRHNCDPDKGSLEALTPAPPTLPEGTEEEYVNNASVQGVSDDGSQALFVAKAALPQVPEAAPGNHAQVYDRFAGGLSLVSVLPGGVASPSESFLGSSWAHNLENAVSADGSRAYWATGSKIYLRLHPEQGIVAGECESATVACTTQVSGKSGGAFFYSASPDGHRAVYSEPNSVTGKLDLFEFEEGSGTRKLGRNVVGMVAAGEDLSRVYFVSRAKLGTQKNERGEEASPEAPNLYLDSEGTLSFIGILSEGDTGQFAPGGDIAAYNLASIDSRVRAARASADGSRLAFQSQAPLTGYDNTSGDGKRAIEVYLYDATANGGAGGLRCVSCNPSGARPTTGELSAPYEKFAINGFVTKAQAAAWIPPFQQSPYPSNVLSADGGRLFFNSYDALLPRDANGAQDVYEWERAGLGSCSEGGASYFAQNGGCLYLISSGESSADSEFWEASRDGSDVFFATTSGLLPQDPGLIDLYDARVDGGFAQPAKATGCEGEACQSPPLAPGEASYGSSSYRGPGNLQEPKPLHCKKKPKKTGHRHKAHRSAKAKGAKRCHKRVHSKRRVAR